MKNLYRKKILLDAVLIWETVLEPRSNLKEKDNPRILKDDFSSGRDSSILTTFV